MNNRISPLVLALILLISIVNVVMFFYYGSLLDNLFLISLTAHVTIVSSFVYFRIKMFSIIEKVLFGLVCLNIVILFFAFNRMAILVIGLVQVLLIIIIVIRSKFGEDHGNSGDTIPN